MPDKLDFGSTEPVEYQIPNIGNEANKYPEMKVRELGYVEVTGEFVKTVSGTHDLYLVFRNPDIRVAEIKID